MNVIKKIFNVLLILIGMIFILLCADIIVNKTVKTDFDSLSATDRQAIGEICDIVNLFDDKKGNSNIWDINYNLYKTGCVIAREHGSLRGRCYLINANANDKLFAQKIKMPDDYDELSVYRFSFCTPRLLELFKPSLKEGFISVNGKSTFYSKYDVSTVKYNGSGSLEESFVKNTFAAALDSPDQPQSVNNVSYSLDEENIALTGLQYRIIDDLLTADVSDDIDELIFEYVTVREYQYSLHPDFVGRTELSLLCTDYVIIRNGEVIRKITAEELKRECHEYFRISAADNTMLPAVLQNQLGITDFSTERDGSVRLYERTGEIALISRTLYENGIIPVEMHMHDANLEQYYMNLVGDTDVQRHEGADIPDAAE